MDISIHILPIICYKEGEIIKKIVVIFIIIIILSLCACEQAPDDGTTVNSDVLAQNEAFSLSFGTSMPADSYVADAMKQIKKVCEDGSNGRLKINLYFDNSLGDADITLQNLNNHTVDMACYNTSDIFDYRFTLNSIPYLLNSPEQIEYYYSPGSIFYENYKLFFEPLGAKLLGIYADGYAGIAFSEKPSYYSEADTQKYVMIRKGPSDVHSYVLDAMHFSSTTVPLDEVTRAYYLNAVQGSFGLSAIATDEILGTTAKYWLEINPFVDTLDFTISLATWDALPEKFQDMLQNAVTEVCKNQFAVMESHNSEALEFLQNDGTIILDLSEETYNMYKQQIINNSWPKISAKVGNDLFATIINDPNLKKLK